MSLDDVGELFMGEDKKVYRMIYGCAQPTATLECIEHADGEEPHRIGGALGCPNLSGFKRLVCED